MTLITIGFGLTAGNFLYQGFTDRRWARAIETSWFQIIALIAAGVSQ